MQLAVHGVDTSMERHETEKFGQDVIEFMDILLGKARVLSAALRLAFMAGMKSRNKASVFLCDDLIEQVGQLVTSARVARAVFTATEMQRAESCLSGAFAQYAITTDGTQVTRKRQRVGNQQ
jgi:hypothetical protein